MTDRPQEPSVGDPLAIFQDLPRVEVSDDEVEEMQRQVLALARWSEAVDDDDLFSGRDSRRSLITRGRMFAAAAAVVVGLGASALVLQMTAQEAGEASNQATPAEIAQTRLETELSHLLDVLPLVEELDAAPNRVTYQFDEGDLDVVMVVDEGLDL